MPDEKTTVEFEAAPKWAISLTEKVNVMSTANGRIEDKVDTMGANLELVTGDVKGLKSDVRALQNWKLSEEERRDKHSGGIRQISQSDEGQNIQLAAHGAVLAEHGVKIDTLITATEALTTAQAASGAATAVALTSIQTDVKSFASKHPGLMLALIGLVTALAGGATTCVNERMHPAPPPSNTTAVTVVTTQQQPTDAGAPDARAQ
jgi:hypothetical protein